MCFAFGAGRSCAGSNARMEERATPERALRERDRPRAWAAICSRPEPSVALIEVGVGLDFGFAMAASLTKSGRAGLKRARNCGHVRCRARTGPVRAVFSDAALGNLEQALGLHRRGGVIVLRDDLSIGPIDRTDGRHRSPRLSDRQGQIVAADRIGVRQLAGESRHDREPADVAWHAAPARLPREFRMASSCLDVEG